MKNLDVWNNLKQPPSWALRTITDGRLRGKSDINPQWRYLAITEQFGVVGQGWKYEIKRLWTEPAPGDQVFAFAEINLFVKFDEWSEPIPGIGGSMLVAEEKRGPHASDEAFKMAVTDALSVAMKMLGVGADVYMGRWDGSKYLETPEAKKKEPPALPFPDFKDVLARIDKLKSQIVDIDGTDKAYWEALKLYGVETSADFKTRDAMIDFGKDLKSYIDKKGGQDGR